MLAPLSQLRHGPDTPNAQTEPCRIRLLTRQACQMALEITTTQGRIQNRYKFMCIFLLFPVHSQARPSPRHTSVFGLSYSVDQPNSSFFDTCQAFSSILASIQISCLHAARQLLQQKCCPQTHRYTTVPCSTFRPGSGHCGRGSTANCSGADLLDLMKHRQTCYLAAKALYLMT